MKKYLDSNDSVTFICYSFLENIQLSPSYSFDSLDDFIHLPSGEANTWKDNSREMGKNSHFW